MKRLDVRVAVHDLQQSIRFYSAMFAAQPAIATLEQKGASCRAPVIG